MSERTQSPGGIKVEDRKVFFKYKKPQSNRWRTMRLDVMVLVPSGGLVRLADSCGAFSSPAAAGLPTGFIHPVE